MTSASARAVSIAAVLVSIPVTLKYLGVERFSVWMTITSLTALLAFADFGLGNGLLNAVARCSARQETAGLRAYVSTALLTLTAVGLLGIAAAVLIVPAISWCDLLAVDPGRVSPGELARAMSILVVCLAIAIPVTVVQKVQLALQLGYLASLWQLAASLAGLTALIAAVSLHASLGWLVAASIGTPSVVLAVSALVFWTYQRPEYRPGLSLAKASYATELARSGGLFFVIQVAGAIAFASDTVIIAHVLGPQAVAQYSVAARLIDGMVMVSAIFLTPLWPAYADAYARGDQRWIRRTLVASLGATAIATALMAIGLISVSRFVTSAWVGNKIPYSMALFVACSAWAVIKATGNALATFLNGLGWIAFQALLAVLFALAAVLTKIAFAQELGLIGIPIALALSYTVTIAVPYAWRMPQLFAKVSS